MSVDITLQKIELLWDCLRLRVEVVSNFILGHYFGEGHPYRDIGFELPGCSPDFEVSCQTSYPWPKDNYEVTFCVPPCLLFASEEEVGAYLKGLPNDPPVRRTLYSY